ncbi:MAG: ZIP family metal transporter [Candidatus Nitrosocosmicus sp.]
MKKIENKTIKDKENKNVRVDDRESFVEKNMITQNNPFDIKTRDKEFVSAPNDIDGNMVGSLSNPGGGRKKLKSLVLAILPLVILAGMVYFLAGPYGQNLIDGGTPLPEVTIEKVEFHENQIVVFIRNTGPEEVTISQADVNDRIHSAAIEPSQTLSRLGEARVIIPFLWNPAEPYEVGVTTSDGTRFSNTVEAAAPAPIPSINQVTVFALLGIFVGVIPVLIGLTWYPFMRKITTNQYNFFLSLTAGLLVFLGIDAFLESNEIAISNLAGTFNGQMLIIVTIAITFLGLFSLSDYFGKRIKGKEKGNDMQFSKINSQSFNTSDSSLIDKDKDIPIPRSATVASKNKNTERQDKGKYLTPINYQQRIMKPLLISLMIAIGIGLHNFGEGLAIGAAVLLGEVALSTFLIIGFTVHNTTEGLAIVAPLAKTGKLMIKRLVLMGLIAGVPTIIGTWMGGFIYSPLASIIFLSIGAGAIFQVVFVLSSWMLQSLRASNTSKTLNEIEISTKSVDPSHTNTNSNLAIIFGFIVGLLVMYLTGLLL